jgi:Uma2 family endonuclease
MVDTPIFDPPRDPALSSRALTFDEFLKAFSGRHAEWLPDGTVEERVGTSTVHNSLVRWLAKLIEAYLEHTRSGELFSESYIQRLAEGMPAREPDILIVMNIHHERITSTYLNGPADIVVEVVSPESVERDYGTKFQEYEIGGVQEYWLIDPERRIADIYELGADGVYHRRALDTDDRLTSGVLPQFKLNPALLWTDPKPTTGQTLRLVADMLGVSVDSLLK